MLCCYLFSRSNCISANTYKRWTNTFWCQHTMPIQPRGKRITYKASLCLCLVSEMRRKGKIAKLSGDYFHSDLIQGTTPPAEALPMCEWVLLRTQQGSQRNKQTTWHSKCPVHLFNAHRFRGADSFPHSTSSFQVIVKYLFNCRW